MIYDPNNAEQYRGLLRYTQGEARELGVRDFEDILQNALLSIIAGLNGSPVTIRFVQFRIRYWLRDQRDRTEEQEGVLTFIAPVELEQHSKRRW